MKKRTINITLTFDMSDFPEDMITPKERVMEIIEQDMIDLYSEDEGFCGFLGSEIEIVDE